MRPTVLIAAAPVLLTACNLSGANNNSMTANSSAPEVVPDSVTVNGVTYVRAGLDKIAAAPTAPAPSSSPTSDLPPTISDSGATVPPNTGAGGTAADHGQ